MGSLKRNLGVGRRTQPSADQFMGPVLREQMLGQGPQDLGFAPDATYPRVYGVLVDWPLGEQVVTVLAMRDGSASLYTTSAFGVIGGIGHASVRMAAARLVQTAEGYVESSAAVDSFPYPPDGTVYYHLLTYDGVRRCSGSLEAIERGSDPTAGLFAAAQDEISALRSAVQPDARP